MLIQIAKDFEIMYLNKDICDISSILQKIKNTRKVQ